MKPLTLALAALFLSPTIAHAEPRAAETVAVAPLTYSTRTLPNGLKVFAMPDSSTANVSVQVWYDVGSKDDPVGRSGFAHLFEHLMFKATKNMPPETLDRLTEDVGGENNASTADDYTNYFEVVPANHLERILFAEAERMGSLVINEEYFKSERDVVKEELRQRINASPYGKLFGLYISQTAYQMHPYGRPGIGSLADLDAATVDDVKAFHATYYRPDNAVLVVAGNFKQADLDRWVDQYFGPIAKPSRPIPRVDVTEPVRTAPKTYTVYEPNVPLPAVVIHYPLFDAKSADLAALTVLDAILSAGESSRLYRSLVYDQQIAAEAFTSFDTTKDAGVYAFGAILSDGKTPQEGAKSLLAEIAKVRETAPTQAELDEAKNGLLAAALQERETAFGRAFTLANSVTIYGDPNRSDKLLAEIQAVTADDVKRVAATWLRDDRRVQINYLDEGARNGAPEDAVASAPTIKAQALTIAKSEIPTFVLADEAVRVKPPEPARPVAAKIPAIVERRLENGLRVLVARDGGLPLVSAQLIVPGGSASDPSDKAGLASLTASLLTQGAGDRSAGDFAAAVEALGADISAGAGAENSIMSLSTISNRADAAFALFADAALRPAFADEELERQRQQTLDGLSVALRQPGGLARAAMTRALFGDEGFGGTPTPRSVEALTKADVAGFHSAAWRPSDAVLVIVGDVTPAEGYALANKHFGAWANPDTAPLAAPVAAEAPGRKGRTVVVDLPNSGQAAVTFGALGAPVKASDYYPALVAQTVLGGGYSARLNQEIRIKRGLSYGAGASMPARLATPPIVASAQTKNESADEVVGLMGAEFAKLGAEPVGEIELKARKAALIGGFGRDVETNAGLAGEISSFAFFKLPLAELKRYTAKVEAVESSAVQAAAAKLFDPNAATVVVAGDAKVFFDKLKARRPNVERIPADALNLDKAALR